MSKILLVEKDDSFRERMSKALQEAGHALTSVGAGRKALRLLQQTIFDVVVIDVGLPDVGGMEVINKAKEINRNTVIIITTARSSLQLAVSAMEDGAYYFLRKPFPMRELRIKIDKALEQRCLVNEVHYLRHERKVIYRFDDIIGDSPQMKQVFSLLRKVSKSNSTVLISGETGTGKELVAGALHYNSPRASKSLVKVNCAALPDSILESELFGHEKGAFTGADKQRIGRCEQADGGTLFLDEVSEMSPLTQAKILRFLQEKEFERVGGSSTIRVDVRVIAATNKNLSEQVRAGRFRDDLFFRLHVVNIDIPPLRERKEDIPLLARFFLRKYGGELGKAGLRFADRTIKMMRDYHWPGNIRELENCIERAVLLSDGPEILPQDIRLSDNVLDSPCRAVKLPPQGICLDEAEKSLIIQALERSNWVQKKAAALLGISQRVINYKIKKHGISVPGRAEG